MVKSLIDLLPNIVSVMTFAAIISTMYEKEDTFLVLLVAFGLTSLCFQSFGHISGILFEENAVIAAILTTPLILILSGMESVTPREFDDIFIKLGNMNPMKHCLAIIKVHFYGFNQCPEDQISSEMYKNMLDDDAYDMSWHNLLLLIGFYRILTYICLKLKINSESIEFQSKRMKRIFFK